MARLSSSINYKTIMSHIAMIHFHLMLVTSHTVIISLIIWREGHFDHIVMSPRGNMEASGRGLADLLAGWVVFWLPTALHDIYFFYRWQLVYNNIYSIYIWCKKCKQDK
jgi:hypothetical protein